MHIGVEHRLPVARILGAAHAPIETRTFGDDEVFLHDVAVDAGGGIERDRLSAQLAIDLAMDRQVARADRAIDLAGLADGDVIAVDVARHLTGDY